MIDIIKQTPYEYSSQSRDYQVLARLYTAVFNYTKMYIDNMSIWSSDIDNKLTNLRSRTLNFIPKHMWDLNNLEAITSCFKYLMRNKGTIGALEFCIDILMRVEGIIVKDISSVIAIDPNDSTNIIIRIPENLLTLGIVEDLVRYLLPAGLTYELVEYQETESSGKYSRIYHRKDERNPFAMNYADTKLTVQGLDEYDPGIDSTADNTLTGKFIYELQEGDEWNKKVKRNPDEDNSTRGYELGEVGGTLNG